MIGARSRPRGPLLPSLFRKPCRFISGCCFLGPSSVDVGKNPPSGLLITGRWIFYALQRTTAKRPTAAPAGQKQPGAAEAQATQAEAAATAEGQTDRRERDSDQPNTPPPARQTSHQTRPDSGTRHATLNTETPPKQVRDGRENRRRAGHPPRFPSPPRRPADKAADGAGLTFWPASKGACLGLVGGLAGGFPRPVGGRSPRSPWQGGR